MPWLLTSRPSLVCPPPPAILTSTSTSRLARSTVCSRLPTCLLTASLQHCTSPSPPITRGFARKHGFSFLLSRYHICTPIYTQRSQTKGLFVFSGSHLQHTARKERAGKGNAGSWCAGPRERKPLYLNSWSHSGGRLSDTIHSTIIPD